MRTVVLEHDYDAPPEAAQAIATDLDALRTIMDGVVSFTGLPQGRVHKGQKMSVQVSLFGKPPPQPYTMEVIAMDDAAMTLQSAEKGAGVKSWQHRLSVTATATGARLRDEIEIDAGWLTWAFARWARYLYRQRHAPRVRMLAAKLGRTTP